MKAETIDRKFDRGESIVQYVKWETARRPGLEQRRVNVDFPVWMINALDIEAKRLGVARQALIKILVAEHFDKSDKKNSPRRRATTGQRRVRKDGRS